MSYSDRHYGAGDPNCPICQGIGYVRYEVSEDHPLFGRVVDCECRRSQAEEAQHSYLQRVGGLEHLTDKTFDNFLSQGIGLAEKDKVNLGYAFEQAKTFADNPIGWLLLTGGNGCGKTHLAAAIANCQIDYNRKVYFITAPDLLDHLRESYGKPYEEEDNYSTRFAEIREAPLLILDDLGTESPSAWAQEKLFQILNYRYRARIPTILTTNRSIEEFEPRLRSRLSDPDVVLRIPISAPDFRAYGPTPTKSDLAGLGLFKSMTFESFKKRLELPKDAQNNLQRAVQMAQEYAFKPEGWLVLMGSPGTGKTHLAAAIANQQASQGTPVLFVTVPDLLDHLRATFAPTSTITYDKRFNEIKTVHFLVLDDLTITSPSSWATSWAREKLHQILNYRYNAQLPTVITTTNTDVELENADARITARLRDQRLVRIFKLTVPYYRGTAKQEKQANLLEGS